MKLAPYRGIRVALLDEATYQTLSPEARGVLLALKIGMGRFGIRVEYPVALLERLVAQTGWPAATVTDRMDELERAGWIQRERNVLWVVEQLRDEPSLRVANENHHPAVAEHVASLPKLGILAAFIAHYCDWFGDPEALLATYPPPSHPDGMWDGIGVGSRDAEDPTPIRSPITEDRRQKTENRKGKTEPVSPAGDDSGTPDAPPRPAVSSPELKGGWTAECARMYEPIGMIHPGQIGRALKPVVERYGVERTLEMWAYYIRHAPHMRFGKLDPDHRDTSRMSPVDFAKNAGTWFHKTEPMLEVADAAAAG
jgi:hypothetical protein